MGSAVGRQHGLTDEQIEAVRGDPSQSAALSELEKLVVSYARARTATPVHVSDELFAALAERFNERQLVELTFLIAWENCRARFDHAFGIESEGFFEPPARS